MTDQSLLSQLVSLITQQSAALGEMRGATAAIEHKTDSLRGEVLSHIAATADHRIAQAEFNRTIELKLAQLGASKAIVLPAANDDQPKDDKKAEPRHKRIAAMIVGGGSVLMAIGVAAEPVWGALLNWLVGRWIPSK